MRAPFSFWKPIAGGAVAVVSAVSYGVVDTAGGGQPIVVTVNSSTGCTTIKIGGVACTSFAITDATHVQGVPGAHASGVVNVVVTNGAGDSTTGTGLVEYWGPAQITSIDSYFDSNKGLTITGSTVNAWLEQTRSDSYASTSTFEPTQVASIFGSIPAIRFVNAGGTNTNQWVRSTRRGLASGASYFWVSKWTSTDAVVTDNANNVPLTLVGDSTGSIVAIQGATAGQLQQNDNSGGGRFSGTATTLNDGSARLVGLTHATGGGTTLQFYNGHTADGAAQTSAYSTTRGFDSIGASRSSTGTATSGGDGWSGDVGAVVIVGAVMSGATITKLHAWAQQRFNTL